MNRRQFLTSALIASVAAVINNRGTARADEPKPKPCPCSGWCLEYIPVPIMPDKQPVTVFIPLLTNDD